jgi:hypothetical protein
LGLICMYILRSKDRLALVTMKNVADCDIE